MDCRHAHPELRRKTYVNDNDVQWHGEAAFKPDWSDSSRLVAYTLKKAAPAVGGLYVAFNSGHTPKVVELPNWHGRAWKVRTAALMRLWRLWSAGLCSAAAACTAAWVVAMRLLCCVSTYRLHVCVVSFPAAAAAVPQAVIDTGKLSPFDILMPDEELAPEEVKQVCVFLFWGFRRRVWRVVRCTLQDMVLLECSLCGCAVSRALVGTKSA